MGGSPDAIAFIWAVLSSVSSMYKLFTETSIKLPQFNIKLFNCSQNLFMTKQSQPFDNEFKGLVEIVKKQIEITLLEIFPLWQLEPPLDWKRVVRVIGEENFSITIEPYQGTAT